MTTQQQLAWEEKWKRERQAAVAQTAHLHNANARCNICGKYGHVDELHRFEYQENTAYAYELAEMEAEAQA